MALLAESTTAKLAGQLAQTRGQDDESCPGCGAVLGELERKHLGECIVCWNPRKRPPSDELLDALFGGDPESGTHDPLLPEDNKLSA